MKINLLYLKGTYIAEIVTSDVVISNVEDALGLMSDCIYQGSRKIILNEKNINPAFFDFQNNLAQEILKKFSIYNVKLAIVGDYHKYGKSLDDFISSSQSGNICFVNSLSEAKNKLTE